MATEKHDAWMAAQIRLADGTQIELKGCGKYEPLLDNLRMLRLMQ